ncbi:MAG: hypothetical protein KGJ77_00360 [Acidobacteriota bacterium]|nr:hypothetical protein [Acidobacteriota bacterium]
MDRLLRSLVSRGLRRGFAGEPWWLALAVAAWLVRRARQRGPEVVWSGRIAAGERLVVSAWEGDRGGAPSSSGPG